MAWFALLCAASLGAAPEPSSPPVVLAGWRSVPAPAPELEGVRWFEAEVPAGRWRDPALFWREDDAPFELYLDGALVHRHGEVAPAVGPTHRGYRWHLISLPVELRPGQLLAVRSRELTLPARHTVDLPRLGDRFDHLRALFAGELDRGLGAVAAILLGLSALTVFLRRREQRAFLHFGVWGIASGLVQLSLVGLPQLVLEAPTLWSHLRFLGRAIGPPMLVAFVADVFGGRHAGRLTRAARWTAVGMAPLALLDVPLHRLVHRPMALALNLEYLLCIAALVGQMGVAVRRRAPGAWPLLVAALIAAAAGTHEALVVLGHLPGRPFGSVGLLALLVGMGAVLLSRLRQAFDELQRGVRARDEFLSIASHELRGPLAIISASTELLARGGPAPAERIASVRTYTRHLTRLVEDLLDAARLQYGTLRLRRAPSSIGPLVAEAVAAHRELAREGGVELVAEPPARPVWAELDPTRLDQIIGNLLRNAIRHTPKGGRVTVTVEREGDEALLAVQDTGDGIAPAVRQRLFTLFERGQNPRGEGMGVGLAIVAKLVALHGGSVRADSAGAGRGARFTVRLPCCEEPAQQAELAAPAPTAAAPAGAPRPAVLLIDDNANLRLSMRLLLEHCGFAVSEAAGGRAGIDRLLAGGFDAAVVDLRMPDIDGLDVARTVRASAQGRALRLVALTGNALLSDPDEVRAAGFDAVLLKPAAPEDLTAALRAASR